MEEKVKLLLVDDDPAAIEEWRRPFSQTKYEILEALSGAVALKIVQELKMEHPDALLVVILDVVMPELNGIEVLKRIKAEFPFSKVIIITGNTDTRDIPDTAYSTGLYRGDHFIQKHNFNANDLVRIVEEGIEEQRKQFELFKPI